MLLLRVPSTSHLTKIARVRLKMFSKARGKLLVFTHTPAHPRVGQAKS